MGNCINHILTWVRSFNAVYKISGKKLRQLKNIAEGGYGFVSLVQDVQTGQHYAMKKMICQTPQQKHMYEQEVQVMKDLSHCSHVVGYFGSHEINRDGFLQTYILMEYAEKTVFDLIMESEKKNSIQLSENQILKIIKEVALGLQQMHKAGIYHQDVKVENILLTKQNTAKLCDFGSCTREKIDLAKAPKSMIYRYEEKFQKNTTLMYRPPQMIDVYLKYPVDERVDIWMLGCVLYVLNYKIHPFQQQGKLSIVNASIKYPKTISKKMQKLLRHILTPSPYYRPSLFQIISIIQKWQYSDFQLNPMAQQIMDNQYHIANQNFQEVGKIEWHLMRPEQQSTKDQWGGYQS